MTMIKLPARQKGFGLVEMMISIALGLFLISGAISVLISTKNAQTLNKELSWLQDNARFATRVLTRDLRVAGYYGCSRRQGFSSTLNPAGSGTGWYLNFQNPVEGWNGDAASYPTSEFPSQYVSSTVAGLPLSDLLTLRRAGNRQIEVVDNDPPTSAVIHVAETHPFVSGELLIISDCKQTTVFQARPSNNPMRIVHNTGAAIPGNCTRYLGHLNCSNHVDNRRIFRGEYGAFVMQMKAYAYYVSTTTSGTPALYRRQLIAHSSNAILEDEEFVQGVENMQVVYGYDSDGDGFANRYVNADDVGASDWDKVVTARLHLLFRSLAQVATDPQTFRFFGQDFTPDDRFLRQEFISTVNLRNKS